MKDYGNGKSTGLEQTVSGKILTGLVPADVSMTAEDRAGAAPAGGEGGGHRRQPENGGNAAAVDQAQPARKDPAALLLRSGERLERDHHRGADAVPGQVGPPLGDGPPQGDILGRRAGRRQTGRALFRRPLHGRCRRLGTRARLPQDQRVRFVRLGRRDQGLRRRLEEAPLSPGGNRLGDHQRLRGDRPRRAGRSADGPAEGPLVVVAGVDASGGHVSRPAKHALRFRRESRRAEGTALDHLAGTTSPSSTTWKPTIC